MSHGYFGRICLEHSFTQIVQCFDVSDKIKRNTKNGTFFSLSNILYQKNIHTQTLDNFLFLLLLSCDGFI